MSLWSRLKRLEKCVPSPDEGVTAVEWIIVDPKDFPDGRAPTSFDLDPLPPLPPVPFGAPIPWRIRDTRGNDITPESWKVRPISEVLPS